MLGLGTGAKQSKIEYRDVAQFGSAPGLGPGGRKFESCHPDQNSVKNRLNRRFFGVFSLLFRVLSQIDMSGLG